MSITRAVYFNPAKTAGAIFEADLYCLLGVGWAAFISLGSMAMFSWLENHEGLPFLADVIVIFWIGIGMTVVAFMKQWMAKPSFNTGLFPFEYRQLPCTDCIYSSLQYDNHNTLRGVSKISGKNTS